MQGEFIVCNMHYKSTDRHDQATKLVAHYLTTLNELYHMSENDGNGVFLRTKEGREHLVEYAKQFGVEMEYYEFSEPTAYASSSPNPAAYGFRILRNEALTAELLKIE